MEPAAQKPSTLGFCVLRGPPGALGYSTSCPSLLVPRRSAGLLSETFEYNCWHTRIPRVRSTSWGTRKHPNRQEEYAILSPTSRVRQMARTTSMKIVQQCETWFLVQSISIQVRSPPARLMNGIAILIAICKKPEAISPDRSALRTSLSIHRGSLCR